MITGKRNIGFGSISLDWLIALEGLQACPPNGVPEGIPGGAPGSSGLRVNPGGELAKHLVLGIDMFDEVAE
jgi:hypothetical protein